jgi:abortive infection bacteriophage resistance protein
VNQRQSNWYTDKISLDSINALSNHHRCIFRVISMSELDQLIIWLDTCLNEINCLGNLISTITNNIHVAMISSYDSALRKLCKWSDAFYVSIHAFCAHNQVVPSVSFHDCLRALLLLSIYLHTVRTTYQVMITSSWV